MKNMNLVSDYIHRCQGRLQSIKLLYNGGYFADTVRESQEMVELALKAILRFSNIDAPHIHDVGDVLIAHQENLPKIIVENLKEIAKISKLLRKDREFAFYGTEDLTPSDFYTEEDAKEALTWAEKILKWSEIAVQKAKS